MTGRDWVHHHGASKVRDALRALVGVGITGGCDDCDAVSTLEEQAPGVFTASVGHDPTCPTWGRIRTQSRNGGAA